MGKKRSYPDVEDVLARPWCYYCERDFDDLKILISHQKAKHFKCDRCGRRLNTAGGLAVHMNQVHKEQLTAVENALPNRQGLEVEIFGMEGIPDDVAATHKQRMLQQFYEAQAARRAKSGNVAPGEEPKSKKLKVETPEEVKKRLAEWKIRKSDPNYVASQIETPGSQSPATAVASNSPVPMSAPPFQQLPILGQIPGQPFSIPGHGYPPPNMPVPFAGAPGLPQRPIFNAPPINLQQLQQLHAGGPPGADFNSSNGLPGSIDDLIASVSQEPSKTEAAVSAPEKKTEKKGKDKNSRMVFGDNDISPEEKMAHLSRYAFVRG